MIIEIKNYPPPSYNRREIFRYAGCKGETDAIAEIIDECIAEIDGKLTYKVCYTEVPLSTNGDTVDLGFCKTRSADLAKMLTQCKSAFIFGATVGIEIDRMIKKYSLLSPARALIAQAVGTERIEALCDAFENDIKASKKLTPRFSPGYGDLPLELQRDIFSLLDCPKSIGAALNTSLLISPTKSVTAIIGVK